MNQDILEIIELRERRIQLMFLFLTFIGLCVMLSAILRSVSFYLWLGCLAFYIYGGITWFLKPISKIASRIGDLENETL